MHITTRCNLKVWNNFLLKKTCPAKNILLPGGSFYSFGIFPRLCYAFFEKDAFNVMLQTGFIPLF